MFREYRGRQKGYSHQALKEITQPRKCLFAGPRTRTAIFLYNVLWLHFSSCANNGRMNPHSPDGIVNALRQWHHVSGTGPKGLRPLFFVTAFLVPFLTMSAPLPQVLLWCWDCPDQSYCWCVCIRQQHQLSAMRRKCRPPLLPLFSAWTARRCWADPPRASRPRLIRRFRSRSERWKITSLSTTSTIVWSSDLNTCINN